MLFTKLAKSIADTVSSDFSHNSVDNINHIINEAIKNNSIVFSMLSIGYATHYLDHDGQNRFLEFIDSSEEDKTPALELIHTLNKEKKTRLSDQIEMLINSNLSIRAKVCSIFWAVYLSEPDKQRVILRELERHH